MKSELVALEELQSLDLKTLDFHNELKAIPETLQEMKEEVDHIKDSSPVFKNYINSLEEQPRDRALRVTAFFRDLDSCLCPILKGLRPGGLMVWTLGNRKVGGKRVPLDRILADLLQSHHATLLCKLTRRISSKRMAPKNNIADTISSETILVMRKAV